MTTPNRRLVYLVAVSLDGFIAGPDGDTSAFPLEGDHIDMLVRDYTDTLPAPAQAAFGVQARNDRFDTVVMGWATYEIGLRAGLADPYPHLRQVVFSRHRSHADTEADASVSVSVSVTGEDPVDVVRRAKSEPSDADIWLCGGGSLAAALWTEIDALVLKVNPVVLGDGIPMVAGSRRGGDPFELTASTAYRSGVVVNEYRRPEPAST
jgi:dihydrofolate reductase